MVKQKKAGTSFFGGRVPTSVKEKVRDEAAQFGLKHEFILKEALEGWLKRRKAQ